MTYQSEHDYIKSLIVTWGEDYVYDLIDRGYSPVLLSDGNGESHWRLVLTQPCSCATMPTARSVVSPVSTD